MRGTLAARRRPVQLRRFIPACAGNTWPDRRRASQISVHPRVCGEHDVKEILQSGSSGSSPRVRGTRHGNVLLQGLGRFIPACAGNTKPQQVTTGSCTVHPRVCGEHRDRCPVYHGNVGSSPRVRGTRFHVETEVPVDRFIPACAGNTTLSASQYSALTVHPRVCGEHDVIPTPGFTGTGSSPRVRGTHGRQCRQCASRRFIPACAGNTQHCPPAPYGLSVHPRVCGEHFFAYHGQHGFVGSSPRVRGTRQPAAAGAGGGRFIPACAGNTK